MKAVMYAVKFRRGVKKLPPFETPDWVPVVLALRDLAESADRLNRVMEGIYANDDREGVQRESEFDSEVNHTMRGNNCGDGVRGDICRASTYRQL